MMYNSQNLVSALSIYWRGRFLYRTMATIVSTFVNEDGDTINVYESGVHYNADKGRLVKASEKAMFTPETSRKAKELLAEKKREAIIRGAGKALERSGEWTLPNAADVAEALAEAVMMKALNPDSPKQVDAARFILQEAGMAETQTKPDADAQQFAQAAGDALRQLVEFMREAHSRDVIDAPATDVQQIPADTDIRNE